MIRRVLLAVLVFATACVKEKPAADSTKVKRTDSIIGRDSVRQDPIGGIPSIKDTTKKKKP